MSSTNLEALKALKKLKKLHELIAKSEVSSIHESDEGYLGSGSKDKKKRFVDLMRTTQFKEKETCLRCMKIPARKLAVSC